MDKAKTTSKIKEIIADTIGADSDEIKNESNFNGDLGFDSLDMVELVMNIEKEFGISIDDNDAAKFNTVGEATEYVLKMVTDK